MFQVLSYKRNGKTSRHVSKGNMIKRMSHLVQELLRGINTFTSSNSLFLHDSIENRKQSNSLEKNINEGEDDTVNELEELQEMQTNTSANPIAKSINWRKAPKTYKESILQILREKKNEDKEIDEDEYFLLSLLLSFKKFNNDQKFIACTQIMTVI